MTRISFVVPIMIESEMNVTDHWTKRRKRFNEQKQAVYVLWPKPRYRDYGNGPIKVTLTRIAPRMLDTDNLASGFKGIRDQIADIIGFDDGLEVYTWICNQEKGSPKEYAARIEIEY